MSVKWDKWILDRLFIAAPELAFNTSLVNELVRVGVLSPEHVKIFRKLSRIHGGVRKLRGKTLLERIMVVAPELISVRTVDLLSKLNLISSRDAHVMRMTLRVVSRVLPMPLSFGTIWERMAMVYDDIFSNEMVAFLRDLDNAQIEALAEVFRRFPENFGKREFIFGHKIGTLTSGDATIIREMLIRSIRRAQVLRSVISTGRIARDTLAQARALDSVWDILGVIFDNALGERMLKNLVRAGVISPERYELFRHVEQLGLGIWRKIAKGVEYESWAARGLLLSEGVLSPELIKVLRDLGIISQRMATMLQPVSQALRIVTRGLGSKWRTARRYRVIPGETPIKTFARHTEMTDRAILRLLSQAADDAARDAERLMATKTFGNLTRARQQQVLAREMHKTMRSMWEDVGHLTIFGEKETAKAALESTAELAKLLGSNEAGQTVERSLLQSARAGVDSFISREESLRSLSRRVYKNAALHSGVLDREIAKGLLRGLSSHELAAIIRDYIRPDVRGGASYAAMRLARTEINNAFHQTAIRYTREMPWVEGYQWHLSGSHPRTDICNSYAQDSHGPGGRGFYSKSNVPGKPHPQCLCYITPATVDNATFYKRLRTGAYDPYIDQITRQGTFDEDLYTPTRYQTIANNAAKAVVVYGIGAAARHFLG